MILIDIKVFGHKEIIDCYIEMSIELWIIKESFGEAWREICTTHSGKLMLRLKLGNSVLNNYSYV